MPFKLLRQSVFIWSSNSFKIRTTNSSPACSAPSLTNLDLTALSQEAEVDWDNFSPEIPTRNPYVLFRDPSIQQRQARSVSIPSSGWGYPSSVPGPGTREDAEHEFLQLMPPGRWERKVGGFYDQELQPSALSSLPLWWQQLSRLARGGCGVWGLLVQAAQCIPVNKR